MSYKAPFLSKGDLQEKAGSFLRKWNKSRDIPVPIEKIVEFDFGLDIVPVPGLQRNFDVVAYITRDCREIRVDQYVFESREARYRFSLAHELGHCILHPDLFEYLDFRDIQGWKDAVTNSIAEKEYRFLEYHANCFAGLVLVPPAELAESFDKWRGKLAELGLVLGETHDGVRETLEYYIGCEFKVSAAVINKRMEFDGLWKTLLG